MLLSASAFGDAIPPTAEIAVTTLADLFGLFGQAAAPEPILGITHDSRRAQPRFLFVALPGRRFDGHDYIHDAIRSGAAGVISERVAQIRVPHLVVADAHAALSRVSAEFHGNPSRKLYVIGVTGTKGKTTTCHLIHHILQANGHATGLITTIGVIHGTDALIPPGHMTTPNAPDVQATLAEMVRRGEQFAVLETSSHALVQKRVADVEYDLAVWTHLEPEHFEVHGNMEAYFRAKAMLVEMARFSVLNCEDPFARRLTGRPHVGYGGPAAQFRASSVEQKCDGVALRLETPGWSGDARIPVIGTFNVENVLAAVAAVTQAGVHPADAVDAMATFAGVTGRMQVVVARPVRGIVDFAHTPDSLRRALAAARSTGEGRLIVVFGCTGERDPRKRAPMGRIAMENADLVVVTEDDSYREDPIRIMGEVERGMLCAGGSAERDYLMVRDRREAIRAAANLAGDGDTILVAGKGHERTIQRADTSVPWSDADELRTALGSRS